MLRWRGDESLEVYACVNDEDWAKWVGAVRVAKVDSTTAAGLPRMDFSQEQLREFDQMAQGLLSLNARSIRPASAEHM